MSELPAGRELDRQVALAIFGTDAPHAIMCEWDLPPFSTDIAAAWEVVEKLADGIHGGFDLVLDWDGGWEACFEIPGGQKVVSVNCDTAPLAICRAALRVGRGGQDG